MRFLIIDQCSGSKEVPNNASEFSAADIDEHGREGLLARDGVPAIPARQLYTGRQQGYIDSAVDRLRAAGDTVDRLYISAGFGLVDEETELPPYNVTFAGMNSSAIDERATRLGIPADVREAVQATPPYDIVVLALGSDYYRACAVESVLDAIPSETLGVIFNQEALATEREHIVSIPARTTEAKEHGAIVVALKGKFLQNLADHRSRGAAMEKLSDLVEYCTTEPTTQTGLSEYD
ncbi:hypothetical protein [Salinigranum marinum]|uniref:hypothetical protein n=1 Tax=Salinigranum marinum TaxID=1515595 RepID=UPI002989BE1C|nr:hypothetical protein [Salinigranum marinum]